MKFKPLVIKSINITPEGITLKGDKGPSKDMQRGWFFPGDLQDLYKAITAGRIRVYTSANAYRWYYLIRETRKSCPTGIDAQAAQFEKLVRTTKNRSCLVKLMDRYVSQAHCLKHPELSSDRDQAIKIPLYKAQFICDQYWIEEPQIIHLT